MLATGLVETLCHAGYVVDILVRKGNESLFAEHPHLRRVLVYDKRARKYADWWRLLREIRAERYDIVVNTHRFLMPGLWAALSGAPRRFGFRQNPLAFTFTHVADHDMVSGPHEVERNHQLLAPLGIARLAPKLHPRESDYAIARGAQRPYVTVAPASIWYTKRYLPEYWATLIAKIPASVQVHLLGGRDDVALCREIAEASGRPCFVRAGELPLLASAALMEGAQMNYVNDSSPLHITSAMNAPVTAFFLSTAPSLGYGPLSDIAVIRGPREPLACRPCGTTGKERCPLGHFKCSDIAPEP